MSITDFVPKSFIFGHGSEPARNVATQEEAGNGDRLVLVAAPTLRPARSQRKSSLMSPLNLPNRENPVASQEPQPQRFYRCFNFERDRRQRLCEAVVREISHRLPRRCSNHGAQTLPGGRRNAQRAAPTENAESASARSMSMILSITPTFAN